jgi:asparagine synthetase B (glutamine-hydrolysing)
LPHGFLIRCQPTRGRFEAILGPDSRRADAHGCSVITAGPVDPEATLERHLVGRLPESPAVPAAVVVWDSRAKKLALVRDRTGLYPLFHARAGGDLTASPDARALLALPDFPREIDPLAVAGWLAGVDDEPAKTLYKALRRVPAGHMLTVDASNDSLSRLWEPPPEGALPARDAQRFGQTLESAVERLVDAPAAVFLSGGIDSSAVAAAAAATSRRAGIPPPLALCVEIEGASEEREQSRVAEALGLERRIRPATARDGLLDRALGRAAESLWPTGSAWQPVFDDLALEARAAGATAILDGIGGDDLLDAALRPAWPALSRGRVGVLRELAAADRAYAGGGMLAVLKATVPRRRRWTAPSFVAEQHQVSLAERAAERRDDLLSTRLAAGWEETWDAGLRQGVAYHHPLWAAAVVELVRGLPLETLVANGQAKSPARTYLSVRLPSISGPWPRPAIADSLQAALEDEYRAKNPAANQLQMLADLGVIALDTRSGGLPRPISGTLLLCEKWLRSRA